MEEEDEGLASWLHLMVHQWGLGSRTGGNDSKPTKATADLMNKRAEFYLRGGHGIKPCAHRTSQKLSDCNACDFCRNLEEQML